MASALVSKQPATLTLSLPEGDFALISLYGGQVLSWRTADGCEQLYCAPSAHATVAAGTASRPLRGGVPVCFPQFADRGQLPKHGFARTSGWFVASPQGLPETRYGTAQVTLVLCDSSESLALWPFPFLLALTVTLGRGSLSIDCVVQNTGSRSHAFTMALHTYLRCSDVTQASLRGLEGCQYEDALDGGVLKTQHEPALRIADEIDRIYASGAAAVRMIDGDRNGGERAVVLSQYGFDDLVVWNPALIKATALGDMPAEDWRRMLCIESGKILSPVVLPPGKAWRAGQHLQYVKGARP